MPAVDDNDLVTDGPELLVRRRHGAWRVLDPFEWTGRALLNAAQDLKSVLVLAVGYIAVIESILWAVTGSPSSGLSEVVDAGSFASQRIVPYIFKRIVPFFSFAAVLASIWLLYSHFWRNPEREMLWRRTLRLLAPLFHLEPWARLFLFSVIFTFFAGSFVSFKALIPALNPYTWDPAFATADRLLHGGIAPWRLTWSVFGSAWGTRFLDIVYGSWFVVIYSAPMAVLMFDANRQRRLVFLLSHLLLWVVLGSAFAVLFSSVGPCFYEPLTGLPGDFALLMKNLHTLDQAEPLLAVWIQNFLWEGYSGLHNKPIEGISAMPSLHIAHVVLLACLAQTFNRPLTILAWGYAFLIFLGSVHLGWHYAIDGYVAGVVAIAIWWGMRRALKLTI